MELGMSYSLVGTKRSSLNASKSRILVKGGEEDDIDATEPKQKRPKPEDIPKDIAISTTRILGRE